MQSDNPMVMEVNRLVGDLLAGGERLLLPGIGSLKPITRPAYRLSKKEVMPPMRTVEFSAEERGLSLVDRIAVAAACTQEESLEVYRRWLGHTQQEGELTIEGVGVLKQHHFKVAEAFAERLNPAGRKPVAVRRRRRGFDWMVLVGILAILVAGGIAWYGYRLMQQKPAPKVQAVESTYAKADTTTVAQPVDTVVQAAKPAQAAQPAVTASAAPTDEVQRMTSGVKYVVLGVFSTEENARRAVSEAAFGADPLRCSIYRFGQKWMVSPYHSDEAVSANEFRKAHAASHPDLWVYQAK